MKWRKYIILSLALLTILLTVIYQFGLLTIKEVNFDLAGIDCVKEEDIRSQLQLEGKPIWQLNLDYISQDIEKMNLCLDQVRLRYNPPQTVEVSLTERAPIAKIISYQPLVNLDLKEASPSSSSALIDWSFPDASVAGFLVDRQGILFLKSVNFNPTLFYPESNLEIGKRLDKKIFEAISLVFSKIPKMGLISSQAKINQGFLQLDSKPRVVFNPSGDILRQLASLQLILAQTTMNDEIIEMIDLRFDKPVVIFTSKKRGDS